MSGLTTIERAFELARAGACHTVQEIRRQLSREGYESVEAHLSGAGTRGRLKAILDARRGSAPPALAPSEV